MNDPTTDAIEELIEWHTDRLGLELRAQAKQARTQLADLLAKLKRAEADAFESHHRAEDYKAQSLDLRARLSALEAEAEASRLALRAARNQIGCNCHVEPVGFMCSFCANAIDFIDAALARDQKPCQHPIDRMLEYDGSLKCYACGQYWADVKNWPEHARLARDQKEGKK